MAKILLVEDYEAIRDAYFFALRAEGFEVDAASSGAEALEKVEAAQYDLICLDMVMLGFSGMDFLEQWRAEQPTSRTKVVVLSNIDSPKVVARAKALKVDRYLVKSHYTPAQLAKVIRESLGEVKGV